MKGDARIARIWEGTVSLEKADAYERYLAGFGVEDYQRVEGNAGVSLMRSDRDGCASFLLISYWTSRDAIEAYAGPEWERAHYYPYDLECLLDPPPTVLHYQVLAPHPVPKR